MELRVLDDESALIYKKTRLLKGGFFTAIFSERFSKALCLLK
ncbi:hypothetical protein HS3_04085 [Bacillus subtilis]|nr:hypothetical protein HS3_04085 [Bacillus subtilis]